MKKFTIYYRLKGDLLGEPIASETVKANSCLDALSRRGHLDKTWHSIKCNGKLIISLVQFRQGVKFPSF